MRLLAFAENRERQVFNLVLTNVPANPADATISSVRSAIVRFENGREGSRLASALAIISANPLWPPDAA